MTDWLLLRGLTRETGHWGDFPRHLAGALPRARVVAVDLPGNGARHGERSPADVAALARDARAAAAAAGLVAPFGVVALSLGAMVAAAWARTHPGDFHAAVLVGTSLRPFSPLHHRLRPAAWGTLLRIATARDPVAAEQAVWDLTSRRPPTDREAVVRAWAALRAAHPVRPANAVRQLWAAARHRAPADAPGVPLLLLAGAGDRLVQPACTLALGAAWRAPVRLHPWAGHDLPLDDPAWVARAVADWVRAGRPRAP